MYRHKPCSSLLDSCQSDGIGGHLSAAEVLKTSLKVPDPFSRHLMGCEGLQSLKAHDCVSCTAMPKRQHSNRL